MNHLANVDWLIVLAYLVGVIGLGIWLGKGQKTTRDYFLGNKNVPWWGVSLSIVATETSAFTFIAIPAAVFFTHPETGEPGNLAFIQVVIGYIVARVLIAIFMVPAYFRGEIYSPYQLISNAFGQGARRATAGVFLIAGTLAAGVRVYVSSVPIELMLGIDTLHAIALFVIFSLVYTYIGGIKAVVWTDAAQFILLIGGGIFTLFYIPTLIDGGWRAAMDQAGASGRLEWFNGEFSFTPPYNIWMGVLGGAIFGMSTHGVDQLIVQRVLTCGTVAEGRKALILSAVIILPLFLIFLLIGALLWVYFQHCAMLIEMPEASRGFAKHIYVFPIFILSVMPPVVKGLLVVGILAAAMSSVSSALSALASVSTMDIVKELDRKERDESAYLTFSKRSTVFWAGILVLVAFLTREEQSLLDTAFALHGLTTGGMLGAMLLAMWWGRGRSAPVVAGIGVSMLVMIAVELWTPIAWPWYTAIGAAVTFVVAFAIRAVSRPVAVGMAYSSIGMIVVELWQPIAWPWHSALGISITFGVAFLATAISVKNRPADSKNTT